MGVDAVTEVVGVRPHGLHVGSGRWWPRVPPVGWARSSFTTPELGRRKGAWRFDAQRAIHAAVQAGAVSLLESATFQQMLFNHSDARGKDICVRRDTLGRGLGRCERTVRRHVKALIDAGFLEVEHQAKRQKTGRVTQVPNRYRFQIPATFAPAPSRSANPADEPRVPPAALQSRPQPPLTFPEPFVESDEDRERRDVLRGLTPADREQRAQAAASLIAVAGDVDEVRLGELLTAAGFTGPEIAYAIRARARHGP